MNMLASLINRLLPVYLPIGKGRVIGIWNPGRLSRQRSLKATLGDLRITVRTADEYRLVKVIKEGNLNY